MNDTMTTASEAQATAPFAPEAGDDVFLPARTRRMPIGLRIWFDERLFERAKEMARYLSKAEGTTPQHLLGKPEACFFVVECSLNWNLSVSQVARATYQTPAGRIGYEGKLCQAILEASGQLEGPVTYEHYGDWQKVRGKFVIKRSDRGKDFAAPTWTREDAKGLGVTVRAKVRGEPKPREWSFDLDQAFPLNSTLWATDPKTQICYTAVRRFASVAAPGLFMGVTFDDDDTQYMRDITPPRPKREAYEHPATKKPSEEPPTTPEEGLVAPELNLVSAAGEIVLTTISPQQWTTAFEKEIRAAADLAAFATIWDNNREVVDQLAEGLADQARDAANDRETQLLARQAQARAPAEDEPPLDEQRSETDWKALAEDLGAEAMKFEGSRALKQWFETDEAVARLKRGQPVLYTGLMATVNGRLKSLTARKA